MQDHRPYRIALVTVVAVVAIGGCAGSHSSVRDRSTGSTSPSTRSITESRNASRHAERHFTDGLLLEMRERHLEAIVEFRRALQFDSTRSSIYYAIGKSFRELNEIDSAIGYTRLAAERGAPPAVHEQLADMLIITGDFDGASIHLDSILANDENNLQARFTRARLRQHRDPDRAIADYEYILRNLANDLDVMLRLTEMHLESRNIDAAVTMMYRMVALDPGSMDIRQMASTMLLDAARYEDALANVRGAVEHIPSGPEIDAFMLATLREIDERLADRQSPNDSLVVYARELVTRAAARAQSADARMYAGTVALRIDEHARAEMLFVRALDDPHATAQTCAHIASTYLVGEDPATGLRVVAQRAFRFADDQRVAYLVGLLHAESGNPDSAVAWLLRSVAINDDNADAWGALGQLYDGMGKTGASDAAYDRSTGLDDVSPKIMSDYAVVLARRGVHLDRALELINAALSIQPENATFRDTRDDIQAKMDAVR